jgi:hypothetical protein
MVWPATANGQEKGKAKGKGGQSSSVPSGRSAGELPAGLERYESKRGDELPPGLDKYEDKKGSLPKGLESGGKKTTKEEKQSKKKGKAKAKSESKGKTKKSEESKSKSSQ